MRRWSVILLLVFVLLIPPAQAADRHALDRFLDDHARKFGLPGAALVVVDESATVHEWSYGDWGATDNAYYLGSVSKTVTAAAVLQLINNGVVSATQPVYELLPEIAFEGPLATTLTISHLLNHTSGLSRRSGFTEIPPVDRLEDAQLTVELQHAPGANQGYSSLNYTILGLLIERITGQSFDAVVREQILGPVGMDSTTARTPIKDSPVDGRQYWFGVPIPRREPQFDASAIPAGYMVSSPIDMGRFLSAHLRSDAQKGLLLPGGSTLPAPLAQAGGRVAGWSVGSIAGHRVLHMSGATATSYSFAAMAPAEDLAFIFMTSVNAFNPIANSIDGVPEGILALLLGGTVEQQFPYNRLLLAGFGIILLLAIAGFVRALIRWFRAGTPLRAPLAAAVLCMRLSSIFCFRSDYLYCFLASLRSACNR
jgi:CubicO group peptidase (beta-lactamase class C family)